MSKTASMFVITVVAICSVLAAYAYQQRRQKILPGTYSMVLLDSGQVFFGKLSNRESASPELTDVFYIHNEVDSATKQPKSVLLKRGSELHGPHRMILTRAHVVLVEDVGPNSQVAHLIDASERP